MELELAKDTFRWFNANYKRTSTGEINYKDDSSQTMNYTKASTLGKGVAKGDATCRRSQKGSCCNSTGYNLVNKHVPCKKPH